MQGVLCRCYVNEFLSHCLSIVTSVPVLILHCELGFVLSHILFHLVTSYVDNKC